jgi:hypothetical protein
MSFLLLGFLKENSQARISIARATLLASFIIQSLELGLVLNKLGKISTR